MRKGDKVAFTVGKLSRLVSGEVIFCNRIHFTVHNGRYPESFFFRDHPNLDREQRKKRSLA